MTTLTNGVSWGGNPKLGGMTFRKRAFDILLALTLLIPLSIVMAVVALILLITQGRPIFYVAPRMRSPGRSFDQLKFRTMLRHERDSGATGAHKNWRITKVGRFLRRTRIDELPQLFNILLGDMSFVGPRPPLREFVERFPAQYAQVLRNRPGVTGLATMIYHAHEDAIMARCKTAEQTENAYFRRCLPTKLRIDLIYLHRASLRMDLWIIMNTVMTVILPNWQGRRPYRERDNSLTPTATSAKTKPAKVKAKKKAPGDVDSLGTSAPQAKVVKAGLPNQIDPAQPMVQPLLAPQTGAAQLASTQAAATQPGLAAAPISAGLEDANRAVSRDL
ncbi:sugar transferase [Paracoccus sp. (in: a-proteobacteria)]|uniref:sugar transferase n=1 Tax=Paracoccus sp. TaxID=267 RepID=UPI00289D0D86|nr:sugar transferase [Paracoccus sp. (in: a-proteobacteria)]